MADLLERERRNDIDRSSLTSAEEGYEDAYTEDEGYGFRESVEKPKQKAGYLIAANSTFPSNLNKVYEEPDLRQPIYDLTSDNAYYTVISTYEIKDGWVKTTFKGDENRITGYVYHDLFVLQMPEIEILSSRSSGGNTTAVKTEDGANFYNKPQGVILETLPFNTVVYVISVDEQDWAYVEYENKRGYVNVKRLSTGTPMPGSQAKLYKINDGDTAERVVNEFFNLNKDEDRRYYVNVLLYLNNPNNLDTRGIYTEDQLDLLEWLTIDYDRIKLRKDYLIWVPDKTYADSLMHKVNSGSYSKEWNKKITEATEGIRNTVDKFWPIGFGAYYGASVGATFIAPIGVDGYIETYFYRKDENTIALKKYDKVAAGLDTGFSAGFYVGKKGTKKGDSVKGVQGGGNAEAKLAGLSYAEFEFPIDDGDAILSALLAITNQSENTVAKATIALLDIIGDTQLSPDHYLKKTKMALAVELQASINARAGLSKAPGNNEKDSYIEKGSFGSERGTNAYSDSVLDTANPYNKEQSFKDLLASQLNVSAGALVGANLKFGIELEHERAMEDGKSTIKSTELSVFIEAGSKAEANINIPLLVNLGMNKDRSIGVKLIWKGNMETGDYNFQGIKLYTATGEMDYYSGSASETEIALGDSLSESLETIRNLDATSFKTLIAQVKYKKRIELVNFLSRKANIIKERNANYRSAGKHSARKNYWQINGYLDVEVDFSKISNKALDIVIGIISDFFVGETIKEKLLNGLQAIFDFINGDFESVKDKYTGQSLNNFYAALKYLFSKEMLPTAILHVRVGAGMAGGFNASAGAKVKLYGDISGGVLVEYDVKDKLINLIEDAGIFIINYAQDKLTEVQQAKLEEHVIENAGF